MPFDRLPVYDTAKSETDCCTLIDPREWDGLELEFDDKLFILARTHAVFHVPVDMGRVFQRVQEHLENAGAYDAAGFLVLSRDLGSWTSEHYFAAAKEVPGEEMVRMNGHYVTKVFDGPYAETKTWHTEMKELARARGKEDGEVLFFYTACPACADHYGHNYVVGFAEI